MCKNASCFPIGFLLKLHSVFFCITRVLCCLQGNTNMLILKCNVSFGILFLFVKINLEDVPDGQNP